MSRKAGGRKQPQCSGSGSSTRKGQSQQPAHQLGYGRAAGQTPLQPHCDGSSSSSSSNSTGTLSKPKPPAHPGRARCGRRMRHTAASAGAPPARRRCPCPETCGGSGMEGIDPSVAAQRLASKLASTHLRPMCTSRPQGRSRLPQRSSACPPCTASIAEGPAGSRT